MNKIGSLQITAGKRFKKRLHADRKNCTFTGDMIFIIQHSPVTPP